MLEDQWKRTKFIQSIIKIFQCIISSLKCWNDFKEIMKMGTDLL